MNNKPYFLKDETDRKHYLAIAELVREKLGRNSDRNKQIIYWKAALLPLLYLTFYIVSIRHLSSPWIVLSCYSLMGIMGVFIFLNLIHEATHGLLFQKRKWNRMYLYVFDLIGLNSYIWIQRHNRLHHNYPNLMGWDGDIEQSGLFQIFPQDEPGSHTRWQHLYIFILYPLYLFSWIFIRDFKDFFQKGRAVRRLFTIPLMEFIKLFFFKAFFIGYMIVLPIILGMPLWLAFLAVFVETVAGSIFALMVLLTPHANTENKFPVLSGGNQLDISWLRYQLITTNDVQLNNWWTRNCMANFNYHVAHHLFPSVSYSQAPELTNIIRAYANEHGLPYRSFTLWGSLYRHYLLVKRNAIQAKEIFAEDL
ncbi:fatty acid desaturase family protein [Flavihumibacter fluvii]|uniref:fatty acid desaturase family protein n=1 Tax=Flavihumibacter fluvii TaxID=2838157 RepID=UPI001BDE3954|nr:fatty acid desaturase [Flavihumibacter fluvii]ULQ54499.1 fatty acid desaturase [Flavihumibacter fluvii]